MRFTRFATGLLAAVFACSTWAADLVLTHATIYTAPNQPPLRDGALVIHDGRIVAVGTSAMVAGRTAAASPSAVTHDCTGLTITAGFWNSHVHILPPPLLHAESKSAAELSGALSSMFTRWGFTTVFDIGSPLANTNIVRQRVASGEVTGPRIFTAGEPFWAEVPVYVQKYFEENHIDLPAVTTPEAARKRVDQQVKEGADGIKIFAGSIESDRVVLLPADVAKSVVGEAHRNHRLVFSHPSSIKGVELSLDSGVDILAHVSDFEGPWPPALVARMRAAHMSLIPTLTLFDVEAKKAHASAENTAQLIDLAVGQLHRYVQVGGQILFGTDVGYIDHFDTTEEFELMTKAGMTFPQILASLTTTPAERFGYSAHSGHIAPGMDADLVLLEGDPARNIGALAKVKATVRGGHLIYGNY